MTFNNTPINLARSVETGKYIVKFNATAISHSNCFKRFWLDCIGGYRDALMPNDVEFGSAFHIFTSEIVKSPTKDLGLAIGKAQHYYATTPMYHKERKEYLTREYLSTVCHKYYEEVLSKDCLTTVQLEDGTPLVEQNFAIPVAVTDVAEYILCGTIDRIVKTGNTGRVSLLDYKTTGKYAKAADAFFLEKELSSQLLCYTIAARYLPTVNPESELAQILAHIPSFLIEGIFIPSGVSIEFKRSKYITFTQEQLNEWMISLNNLVKKISAVLKGESELTREGMFNGACGGGYSLCKYFKSCACPDEVAAGQILKREFLSVVYDPLNHNRGLAEFAKMKQLAATI